MTGSGLRARPLTIANMIAEELRSRILSGDIPAGSRLQQNDVARQFDVSSTPVREAFAELRRHGLVTGTEHRGVRVIRPTLDDAIEASEVDELLEGVCIARSAPLLTDDDLAQARRLLDEHRSTPVTDLRRRLELDTAFHLSLLVRCPNAKLRGLTETAHRDTTVYRQMLYPVGDTEMAQHLLDAIYQQHEAIYAACVERAGELAAERTIEHIRWGRELFREMLG